MFVFVASRAFASCSGRAWAAGSTLRCGCGDDVCRADAGEHLEPGGGAGASAAARFVVRRSGLRPFECQRLSAEDEAVEPYRATPGGRLCAEDARKEVFRGHML